MTYDPKWLRASYQVPSTYSVRVVVSSPLCGKALPTPGPATVQLALIRSAIELYGLAAARDSLFSHIVACNPLIQPPDMVAVTSQLQRVYKADDSGRLIEGVGHREYCHCKGHIRIHLSVPNALMEEFAALCRMIGYWGRNDSLACCTEVASVQPEPGQYAQRFGELPPKLRVHNCFSAFATELASPEITWADIVPVNSIVAKSPVSPQLYMWPLVSSEPQSSGPVLRFCSLL